MEDELLRAAHDGTTDLASVSTVVAGAISSKLHNGGEAWVRMSWLRAARAVGRDAWLIEQISHPSPEHVRYFQDVTAWFGLADRAILADAGGRAVVGPDDIDPRDVADAADVLLNISGHLHGPTLFERFSRRVLIDIDPGFTQMWHAQGLTGAMVDGHDALATIGENIGDDDCAIPTGGLPWIPTRQPTCVADWEAGGAPVANCFTTVASWRGSYGPVEHDGHRYGVKAHEFRKVLDLPARCPGAHLEIALDIHAGDHSDRTALVDHGWALSDPAAASATPERFRQYVHRSSAELSVAQGMYVATNSGWFSDRTVRYLASGRPVVVQDTGFTRNLPVGEGLLSFDDAAGAAEAVREVLDDYPRHAAAARRIAEEHFGPRRVIGDLLERVL
jgi:hypothetical protein